MALAVMVCAGEAPAPIVDHYGTPVGVGRSVPPDAEAEGPRSLGSAPSPIAGGKLLLSKRLKLIIKYHQVIPA